MKFASFKEFRQAVANTLEDVVAYLNTDHTKMIRELNVGLSKMSLVDNFDSFVTTETIPAGTEVQIRNGLRNGQVPTYRIILRGDAGSVDVVDGDTAWNTNFVSLKNVGASPATVTVLFLR